jgi:predicted transcriptional regulator
MVAAHELGPLEMQVLGMLHPHDPRPVSAVRDRLHAAGSELAYTTVMTVLVRLQKKGLVRRLRDGNRYLYAAATQAPKVSRGILARVGKALFQKDGARPILALLEADDLSHDELRSLRAVIDAKLDAADGTKKKGSR